MRQRKSKGRTRQEMIYPVTCKCGKERWLKKADAQKDPACFNCSQRERGKKGYQATKAKCGPMFAITCVQTHRLANPSSLEKQVIGILDSYGVQYEREVLFTQGETHYLIDFVINGRQAIEVNGDYPHQFRPAHDQKKYNAMRAAGYQLLVLHESDMKSAGAILCTFLDISIHKVTA